MGEKEGGRSNYDLSSPADLSDINLEVMDRVSRGKQSVDTVGNGSGARGGVDTCQVSPVARSDRPST